MKKKSNEKKAGWIVREPEELLKFLFEMMPSESRKAVKGMLSRGQVTVNDTVTTQFNETLTPGDRITILSQGANPKVKVRGIEILYEDDDLIVIDKEAGLLTIASDKEKQATAYRQLSDYVKSGNPKGRIFIVHRLDRDTSGVMLFAKSKQTQQRLQNAWKSSVRERTYIALVEGTVKENGTVTSWLTEDKTLTMRSSSRPNKGQKAVTRYKVLKAGRESSLLQVNLETGRKNQIRVHMQDIGHPIIGDKKYGSRKNIIGRLGLHASALQFKHPATGEIMRFESKTPAAFTRKI
ncbi:RluA family pseudouridine synthase [Salinicoccus carnicancri]|uniref:RluA family pseudouridine synthase n=1 Tax=Salinicoccus carnicancri TaxID=558170 RepID=UPI0003611653|nr:RluA family pseudouridine synthase [Salinicoccus carnicancri]